MSMSGVHMKNKQTDFGKDNKQINIWIVTGQQSSLIITHCSEENQICNIVDLL